MPTECLSLLPLHNMPARAAADDYCSSPTVVSGYAQHQGMAHGLQD